MTRLGAVKQEIQDLKAGFEPSANEIVLAVNLMSCMINCKISRRASQS